MPSCVRVSTGENRTVIYRTCYNVVDCSVSKKKKKYDANFETRVRYESTVNDCVLRFNYRLYNNRFLCLVRVSKHEYLGSL